MDRRFTVHYIDDHKIALHLLVDENQYIYIYIYQLQLHTTQYIYHVDYWTMSLLQ